MSTEPKTVWLKDYTPPLFRVESVHLTVQIFSGHTRVRSKLSVRRNGTHKEPLKLNGQNLVLKSISLAKESYSLDENFLTVPNAPDYLELETEAEIYPEKNTALEGLFHSGSMYCTQCEPEGFRKITWYLDRPDVMAKFRVRIEAEKKSCPILLSNGNCIEKGEIDAHRHYAVWEDPFFKPCYLFALVAGDLGHIHDTFRTRSGRDVDLFIYTEHGNEDQCLHAMESLKKSMKWDEEVYGREYDLDIYNIVAVGDFNMGAMENKSLNIFNAAYILARPDTATDDDYMGIESVVAHEYFHNWTGNRITCRDWFQLSLKEGLTVFRDQCFSADMNSAPVKRIEDVAGLRHAQFPEDAGPLAHPVRPDNYIEINNFYTATVYEKGAEVIRMMHSILGPEKYRKAMDLYFDRHDGQAVTCDDFAKCMEDASGIDLSQFKLWYSQAGTPEVTAQWIYEEATKNLYLTLSQHLPPTPGKSDKKPMHIPVAVGLLGPDGKDLLPEGTRLLHLKEKKQTFNFSNIAQKPVPSLLRGFSAPVTLKTPHTDEELRFLMMHDSDGFNRWEAGQSYASRVLLDLVAHPEKPVNPQMLEAWDILVDNKTVDTALLAEALILPSETYLAQQMRVIDAQSIHEQRERAAAAIGINSFIKLQKLYESCIESGNYKIDPAAMGRRTLKNIALRYLITAQEKETSPLAFTQFENATNMTDCLAALSLLASTETPERAKALEDFYKKWQSNALVIDKWFSLQARADRKDCLEQVQALTQHPDFTLKNPNRVRALIGAFAAGNPAQFHRADGAGYDFLAEKIITLNGINPQVAARMMTPFRQFRRFDDRRKTLMEEQIRRVANTPGLSPDLFEIATKTLNL